jgi:hypothetical protein
MTDTIGETELVVRGQRVPVNQFFVGPISDTLICSLPGDGTIIVPTTTVNLRDNPNHLGDALPYVIASQTFNPPQQGSYIVAKYNGGSPAYFSITDVEEITESDVAPICTIFKSGTEIHDIDWDGIASGMPNRLHQRFVKTERFSPEPLGLAISVNASRQLFLSAGRVWYGAVRVVIAAFTSATDECELWYHSSLGVWASTAITTYNNTQYDDGSQLVALANNKWAVNWCYRGVETAKHMIIVLANASYHTAAAANDSTEPPLPPIVAKHMILVGRILVEKGTTNAIVQSAFTQRFAPGGASDHENLSGLLGALIGNHYHFGNFATVTLAEAALGGAEGAIIYMLDQNTWYRYVASSTETRNGTSVLNTGEGGTTRWLAFAGRWQVFQYDDIFTDNLIVPAGQTAPDIEAVPGAAGIYAWAFNGTTTTESLSGTFELLHGYRQGSDVYPHLHWSPIAAGTGNVRWVFEYIVRTSTGEFSAPAILTAIQAAGGLGPNGRPIQHDVEFSPVIPGAGLVIGTQIKFVIRREPTNTNDTYANDALLWACGIHYQKDSAGSLQRFVK